MYIDCTKVHSWLIRDLVTWLIKLIYIYLNISDDILTKFNIVIHTKFLDIAADLTIKTHSYQLHVTCHEKTLQNRDNVTMVKLELYCN